MKPTSLQIQLVAAWIDPEDPTIWSRTLHNLTSQLAEFGLYGGYHDATPWPWATAAVNRWLDRTHRLNDLWQLRMEMRSLTTVANAWGRLSTIGNRAGWIIPTGAFGRPVSGRYVTWGEITPAQLTASYPSFTASVGFPGLTPRGLRSLSRQHLRLYRHGHACCVASSWAAASLVADHGVDPSKVKVIGYGRNIDIPPAERDWSTPRFLFVGLDWHRKNGDAVVRAFRRLRDLVPTAELHVVGNHPPLGIEGVHGYGRLDIDRHEDRVKLEGLFERATCFVLPSFLESFGIVYVEAAAAGLASIGTTNGGTSTSIGEGGIRVRPDDDDGLLDAMRRLSDPPIARQLGRRALERSQHFTWRKSAERLVRAFEPALADERGFADFL